MRVTEERARESNGERQRAQWRGADGRRAGCTPIRSRPRARSPRRSGRRLGADVQVKPTRDGRYSAQLSFATAEEAHRAGAAHLRPRGRVS